MKTACAQCGKEMDERDSFTIDFSRKIAMPECIEFAGARMCLKCYMQSRRIESYRTHA